MVPRTSARMDWRETGSMSWRLIEQRPRTRYLSAMNPAKTERGSAGRLLVSSAAAASGRRVQHRTRGLGLLSDRSADAAAMNAAGSVTRRGVAASCWSLLGGTFLSFVSRNEGHLEFVLGQWWQRLARMTSCIVAACAVPSRSGGSRRSRASVPVMSSPSPVIHRGRRRRRLVRHRSGRDAGVGQTGNVGIDTERKGRGVKTLTVQPPGGGSKCKTSGFQSSRTRSLRRLRPPSPRLGG